MRGFYHNHNSQPLDFILNNLRSFCSLNNNVVTVIDDFDDNDDTFYGYFMILSVGQIVWRRNLIVIRRMENFSRIEKDAVLFW